MCKAQDDDLTAALEKAAKLAHIDLQVLLNARQRIAAAHESGSPRALELVLRQLCPADTWHWQEAIDVLQAGGKKGTWVQQIGLLASLISRGIMWGGRVRQLHEYRQCPTLQFRVVGDGRDAPECVALHGTTASLDAPFWAVHAPWKCLRPACRCTVRVMLDW